jgi:hypothetical protein
MVTGFLFLGGAAFVLAALVALALGPSPARMLTLVALGIGAGLVLFAQERPDHAFSWLFMFIVAVNVAAWIVGATVGWAFAQSRSTRRASAP